MIEPIRRKRALALLSVLVLAASSLAAHDFWIVPDAFQVASGDVIAIRGQTSVKFPTSQSAVAPERIAEARLIGASSDERLTDLSTSGKSLLIRHRPTTPGQRIVAVALVSRSVRTTPERLRRYIALEGAPDLSDRYEREGAYPKTDSVTQVSAKFAKTVVEVGRGGPRAFAKAVGHILELVPLNDPATLRGGDTVVVRLLSHGRPISGAQLHAGAAPAGLTAVSDSAQVAGVAATRDIAVETGPDGTARIPLSEAGLWNVRTVYAAATERVAGVAPTWEVNFATLVFNVTALSGGRGSSSDSIEVAATVQRFDAALAAGDSAAALALLANDVLVLESGGIQNRDEYRSQHLAADIASTRAVPSRRSPVTVRIRGDVAWASSTSTTEGEYRGRQINSAGAALMVLSREGEGWKIRAIHWSSRSRRAPGG